MSDGAPSAGRDEMRCDGMRGEGMGSRDKAMWTWHEMRHETCVRGWAQIRG